LKISLPLVIHFPRVTMKNKPFHMNLNVYRNTHHRELNDAKVIYKEHVWGIVMEAGLRASEFKLTPPLRMVYTLYPKTKREVDVSNVLSIVQKFTDDALVELGFIEDDNYKIIRESVYRFGMIDPDNPRAELEIDEYRGDTSTERQVGFDFTD